MSERKSLILRVRITQQEFESLKKIAEANNVSVSEVVRRALRMFREGEEEAGAEAGQPAPKSDDGNSVTIIDRDDLFTMAVADRLLTLLALHGRDIIRFDEIRAYLKTIKPALSPMQEQNIVYMLQGLGILRPIGHVPMVTDGKRRTGLFRISIPEDALLNGIASAILGARQRNNGHELRNKNTYIQPAHPYT
jgi:hypothetical protein